MIEDLIPIDPPPGLYNKGTVYQSKGRWYLGNLIRFFQGKRQPIGGWVQRTLTGSLTGTPNAAIAWSTNAGVRFLAVGTTTGLFVVDASNVVHNITPSGFNAGSGSPSWQLDTFGAYLVAVYNGTGTNPLGAINLFYWAGDTGTAAQPVVDDVLSGPISGFGVVTTPERVLVMLQGADPLTVGGVSAPRAFRAARAGAVATDLVD